MTQRESSGALMQPKLRLDANHAASGDSLVMTVDPGEEHCLSTGLLSCTLERWSGQQWEVEYVLRPAPDPGQASWERAEGTKAFIPVGLAVPLVRYIAIPQDASPGLWRVREAVDGRDRSFELIAEVTVRSPRVSD